MLVRGDKLPEKLRAEIIRAYVHRMTIGNALAHPHHVEYMRQGGYALPLITDAQWLAEHAFYVTKRGTLDRRRRHCEPAFLAEEKA